MKTVFLFKILFVVNFLFCVENSFISKNVFSQNDIRSKHFNIYNNFAIQGYDAVSYFAGKPAKGSKNITYTHQGIKYAFANFTNLEKFKSNPNKYEPQYGGWCAYAMGYGGEKVDIDPSTFKIVDDKLYLFYNAYFNNTKNSWNKDEANLKYKADKNWKSILK